MGRFSRWILVGVAAVLVGGLVTERPLLLGQEQKAAVVLLLPGAEEVEGWGVVEDSLTYCPTPDSLTDIYDGGFGHYVEAGVQRAVVQAYGSEEDLILVYLHEMASPEQAEAIWKELHGSLLDGESGLLSDLEAKDGAFLYVGAGQSSGYLWRERFYCDVVAAGEEEKEQKAVGEFLGLLGKRIACYLGEDEEGAGVPDAGGTCGAEAAESACPQG